MNPVFPILTASLLLFSCNRKQYVPEPLKISEDVKEYPSNIDKQGKDYVYRSGYFKWNREKEKYDYIPGEWVAQKNGYRWDAGEWQKTRLGYRYRKAKWVKAKPEPSKPRVE
jgi:hypothetical protein